MKYVALVYYDESVMKALTQDEWDALNRECIDCGESLRSRDYMIGGEALLSVQTATTLRVRNGKVDITDGPFAETKEQLAGFYLLDVRDLNEAIQMASKIPPARYGSVEIRPVRELQGENNVSYQDTEVRSAP
ncbi:YciI family protein [Photobacterium halotolerans]|uniref:YciI family protein n=1 Tax=Photobacterium halotolerans TaxID=265726 RepID=A0A7X4Y2F8_9GAMM|nr:YciI family protein [Photobacterium halotolerans]NAW64856.1 YciI family protein [Photobacterium halotolerans]NAW88854.1 YciI family protein [Photobacterium halotolerans]NAX48646.1 YciI family protein [Photobacterium halotolerans]